MKILRIIAYALGVYLLFTVPSFAQSTTCPSEMVCISREAGLKAITDAATVKAQEKRIKDLEDAINGKEATATTPAVKGYKDIIADWREKYAQVFGEYTGFKMGAVRVDAAFDIAVKNTKKKCVLSIGCL